MWRMYSAAPWECGIFGNISKACVFPGEVVSFRSFEVRFGAEFLRGVSEHGP